MRQATPPDMSEKNAINFKLGTDNTLLRTGLQQAEGQVQSFKEQTHDMLAGLFAGIGIEQMLSKFSEIKKVSETFDTTSEAVQRASGAAEHFDTTIEAVGTAMAKIRSGRGDVLEKLGIDAEAFKKVGLDQQLVMVAAALEKITDPQERVNKAFEVMGPRAKEIMPMILAGSAKLQEVMGQVATLDNATVDQLAKSDKQLKAMQNTVEVGMGYIFGFINNIMQSVGAFEGGIMAGLVSIASRVGQFFGALSHHDWSGMKASFSTAVSDMVQISYNAKDQIHDIWVPAGAGSESSGGAADTNDNGADGIGKAAKERAPLADRLRDIEQEHATKQLDTQTRLNQLAAERAQLELTLFAMSSDDTEKRADLEDKLVANAKERLKLQDRAREENDKASEASAKARASEKEHAARAAEETQRKAEEDKQRAAKAAEDAKREAERTREQQGRDYFRRAEEQLGFASGKDSRTDYEKGGQHLAGVNYQVVNSEAERGIRLQQDSRNFLQKIAEKEWTVEIPDAQ